MIGNFIYYVGWYGNSPIGLLELKSEYSHKKIFIFGNEKGSPISTSVENKFFIPDHTLLKNILIEYQNYRGESVVNIPNFTRNMNFIIKFMAELF